MTPIQGSQSKDLKTIQMTVLKVDKIRPAKGNARVNLI